MVVARQPREDCALDWFRILQPRGDRTVLRTGQSLVGAHCKGINPIAYRILEYATGYQTSHVGTVVDHLSIIGLSQFDYLLDWVWKEEDARTQYEYLGRLPLIFEVSHQLCRLVDVYRKVLFVERIIIDI